MQQTANATDPQVAAIPLLKLSSVACRSTRAAGAAPDAYVKKMINTRLLSSSFF
jgi:hypothetical protein